MSRSVAIISNLFSLMFNKTLDKIGRVFFFQPRLVQNLTIEATGLYLC